MSGVFSARFGDICREIKVTTRDPIAEGYCRYVGLEHLDSGSLKIKRWGSVAEDSPSFTRVFKKGQILLGKRRPYLKKCAVAEFDGICSGDIIVLEPKPSKIIPGLLRFIIQSDAFWRVAIATSSGSLSPRTKFSALASWEFTVNCSFAQETILDLLIKSQEASEKLIDLQISSAENIRGLYLNFFKNFYERGAGQVALPDNWKTMRLGDLLICVPQSGFSANEVSSDTGNYVLNLNNLSTDGYVLDGELKPIAISDYDAALELKEGDFLISRANTQDLVGLVGIYKPRKDKVIFPDTMMRLRLNEKLIIKEYLEAFLLSPYGRRSIQRVAAGTSASMKKINKKTLSDIPVPVAPIEEQSLIFSTISFFLDVREQLSSLSKSHSILRSRIIEEIIS
ncbi:restriction endonuclease subunit S [Pseudomonas sp. NBRC 111119]|uniref:restriction endonuclease subunit S n=1 Tax=Pseudomonas sp. NBRC 111119 TaxID=1661034 RepID=UPI000A7AED78|nr:restriction endonuclease subunit S [Pseudomonas sp. NBRC 111119]